MGDGAGAMAGRSCQRWRVTRRRCLAAWLDGERAALRRQLAMACEQITAAAERRGEWREVIVAALRWRSVLPDDGRAWAREIHALQSSGRLTEAITRVAEAEQYFRNELRVGVPDDVARLARVLARLGQVAGTPAASLLTPDLVGRGETLAATARARLQVRSADAEVSALLIVAGEGRGKTRVLREFMRQTRDADPAITLIEATALSTDKARPFALLHTVLTRIASHDALAGCSPETLATLAHIAPALREHFRHVPPLDSPQPADVTTAFERALAEVALASPVVLVLDDFPDGDPESLDVLTPLLHKAPLRTVIIAAGRPESWQQSASVSDVLNHADPANRLALEPLRREETRVLLSSMAPLSPATLETLTASLHELSGGIPGLLTSLMTHQVTSGVLTRGETGEFSLGSETSDTAVIPPDLEERWRSRYNQASPDAQRVLDAVAVLGSSGGSKHAEVADLEDIAQLDSNSFRTAFESLRTAGILHRTDDVVMFVAEAHRLLTYRALPPSTRLQLHAGAAKRLRAGTLWPATRSQVEYHRRASRAGSPEIRRRHRRLRCSAGGSGGVVRIPDERRRSECGRSGPACRHREPDGRYDPCPAAVPRGVDRFAAVAPDFRLSALEGAGNARTHAAPRRRHSSRRDAGARSRRTGKPAARRSPGRGAR